MKDANGKKLIVCSYGSGKTNNFCELCRKNVAYHVVDTLLTNELKGESYTYQGKRAICDECGSEVYVAEIEDFNQIALYDEVRKANDIITLDKILEIPEKYGIGKRPLSLLLGWGEMTLTRYCDGYLPTKQYSEILKRIYEDPRYYLTLLEANKDNLKSVSAYEKSKNVTEGLIGANTAANTKMDIVINYLLCKCEDITPLALQKALYYIQGFYYAFKREFIFTEECEAWAHGPVYREIYQRYSSYHFDPISNCVECDESALTIYEKAIVDSVIKNICCYSGKILESFTHSEQPWLITRGDLPVNASSDKVINKNAIGEYFLKVKEKSNMINPLDIEIYSKKMFDCMK